MIQNKRYHYNQITSNETIIDYAFQYFKGRKDYRTILYRINRVQMDKGLLLPFKLVGVDRTQVTNYYYNNEETSSIR
jgi:hypothetical protein